MRSGDRGRELGSDGHWQAASFPSTCGITSSLGKFTRRTTIRCLVCSNQFLFSFSQLTVKWNKWVELA